MPGRYGDRLTYVEADLPAMAARKRQALGRAGSLGEYHQVRDLDALKDTGPDSIAALAAELDRDADLAIVTEGLIAYLSPLDLRALWIRVASALSGFDAGRYVSDLPLARPQTPEVRAFRVGLRRSCAVGSTFISRPRQRRRRR